MFGFELILSAVGSGPTFAIHVKQAGATVMLVETGAPLCVCHEGKTGTIDGVQFSNTPNRCHPQPLSDLLVQKNPTCTVETYSGGLRCCTHKTILLDKEQEVPTAVDTYRMKFRFYYEDYVDQKSSFFMFWTAENGAGEYDIPKCDSNTPPEYCIHTITTTFTALDAIHKCDTPSNVWCGWGWERGSDVLLLRAGTHCHAPACLSEELYDAETGQLICRNVPLYGTGGLTPLNETGYALGIPPCFWGPPPLLPPPRLRQNQTLYSMKRVNSTYGHTGEMAQWQMRGAWAD